MPTDAAIKRVVLKVARKGITRPGHPWVYAAAIRDVEGEPVPGDIVDVVSDKKRFIGRGYYNPQSKITVRLLSRHSETIDQKFIRDRIEKAAEYRKQYLPKANAFRLIASEADGLPGLVVDSYDGILVAQFLTLGMSKMRDDVIHGLRDVLPVRAIYERSDAPALKYEGLEPRVEWIGEPGPEEVLISEGDVRFKVRFGDGHKTGFYLDQRENRLKLAQLGIKGDVLDLFCHSGGFGIHMARAGATTLGIDISEESIRQAEINREANGLGPDVCSFKVGNAFDDLRAFEKEGRRFDMVILDPPSFARNKKAVTGAMSGFKEIILRSLKILNENGTLALFSCSYHIHAQLLLDVAADAAFDAHRTVRILDYFKQSTDHPMLINVPESAYLKGYLFHVA